MHRQRDPPPDDQQAAKRTRMVLSQLRRRDITDERVLNAIRRVPRHLFVPSEHRELAYDDRPLPIGYDQTISQPYIVALMSQLGRARPGLRALDVGTGSGYQAAVLAEICDHVYSLEIVPQLAEAARERLARLGYENIDVRCADAFDGWSEFAPFDVIIAAAAPRQVPQPLVDQLAVGGRLAMPIGGRGSQELIVIERAGPDDIRRFSAGGVAFVPMTGEALRRYA